MSKMRVEPPGTPGWENLSKSNAIKLALMAKAPPSIYNLRGKQQLLELGIQCDWHILHAPLAQISDEWLVIGEFSIAKVTDGVSTAKDKGKAIKIAKWQWHSFCWSSIIV